MKNKHLHWQAVFFDFDGVICNSISVKTDAFSTLFRNYGPLVEKAVVEHHLQTGGMPRRQKIKLYLKKYAQEECNNQKLEEVVNSFSLLVVEKVIAAPFVDGALDSLNSLYDSNIPAFVVSGTPHDEMRLIIKEKNIEKYFKEVHGSPRSKTEIVDDILRRYHYSPGQCLFIGDALLDYNTAMEVGMHFLGITHPSGVVSFPQDVSVSTVVKLSL